MGWSLPHCSVSCDSVDKPMNSWSLSIHPPVILSSLLSFISSGLHPFYAGIPCMFNYISVLHYWTMSIVSDIFIYGVNKIMEAEKLKIRCIFPPIYFFHWKWFRWIFSVCQCVLSVLNITLFLTQKKLDKLFVLYMFYVVILLPDHVSVFS